MSNIFLLIRLASFIGLGTIPIIPITTVNILFSPAAVDSLGTVQSTILVNATLTCFLETKPFDTNPPSHHHQQHKERLERNKKKLL